MIIKSDAVAHSTTAATADRAACHRATLGATITRIDTLTQAAHGRVSTAVSRAVRLLDIPPERRGHLHEMRLRATLRRIGLLSDFAANDINVEAERLGLNSDIDA